MIALKSALEQCAWADAKLFDFLSELTDDAWRAKAAEDEWHVAALTFHLIASADWYHYQLGGTLTFTSEPQSIAEVRALGPVWKAIDDFLIAEALKEDGEVTWVEDGQTFSALRSAVLTEAIIHSVEHRVHIAAALKTGGHPQLKLEDYSVWGFTSNR